MADARVCEIHENLAWTWLWCVEFDDFGGDLAWLIVDDGLVFLWDLWSSHCGCVSFQASVVLMSSSNYSYTKIGMSKKRTRNCKVDFWVFSNRTSRLVHSMWVEL